MPKKYHWLPIVIILVAMLGYRVAWPWYRDRSDNAATDAVIAELELQTARCRKQQERVLDKSVVTDATELMDLLNAQADLPDRVEGVLPRANGNRLVRLERATGEWQESLLELRRHVVNAFNADVESTADQQSGG